MPPEGTAKPRPKSGLAGFKGLAGPPLGARGPSHLDLRLLIEQASDHASASGCVMTHLNKISSDPMMMSMISLLRNIQVASLEHSCCLLTALLTAYAFSKAAS